MKVNVQHCNRCGKYYDANVYDVCPNCSGESTDRVVIERRNSIINKKLSEYDETERVRIDEEYSDEEATMKVSRMELNANTFAENVINTESDMEIEVSCNVSSKDREQYVKYVGWLTVISGDIQGMEYKIQYGKNTIGRYKTNDICLAGDMQVSPKKHAVLMYDAKNIKYYLIDGESSSVIYVNGEPLLQQRELYINDILEIGSIKLIFTPLCSEKFHW